MKYMDVRYLLALSLLCSISGEAMTIGVTRVLHAADNGNGDLLVTQQTSLSQSATVQSLSFNVTQADGSLVLGIYNATGQGGGPGTLLATTASFLPTTGWNTAPVTHQVSLPPGNYWLAYLPSSSQLAFVKQLSGPSYYYSYAFGAMPRTFGLSGASNTTCQWSLFATLNTADPSPTPISNPTPTPSPKPSPTPTPTPTPSPKPTPTPTPSPKPSPTPTPTPTPTAGTPILIQHVATGMDRLPVTTLAITLPNPAGAGNALILGVQFNNAVAVSSIVDNKGNTWIAGPTALNSNTSQVMSLYYALGAKSGTQQIVVHFTGSSSSNEYPQGVVSEFYNVATLSALDGSGSSSSSRTDSLTTTTAGDLIYQWGIDFSDTNSNGGNYNGTNITAGPGFTLLSADLQVGSADQYQVQSTKGTVAATFTASGSATWGSLALALKSASAGTAPPPGIRIVHIQHTLLCSVYSGQNRPRPIVMQFPSSGNLLVASFNSGDVTVAGVSDAAGNTWSVPSSAVTPGGGDVTPAQIVYAANAVTSSTLSGITAKLTGTTTTDCMFILYDLSGASTSPFDNAAVATGDQGSTGNLTTVSLTPSSSNGIAITTNSLYFETANGVVGAGYVLDSVVNGHDDGSPTSTLDEDNGYAHIYYSNTSSLTFVFSLDGSGGVYLWGSVAAAFKGAVSP
jgi:hypothetical protein